jgi:hypothetical protein
MKPLEFDPGKYIGVKNQIVRDENNNLFVVDRKAMKTNAQCLN